LYSGHDDLFKDETVLSKGCDVCMHATLVLKFDLMVFARAWKCAASFAFAMFDLKIGFLIKLMASS